MGALLQYQYQSSLDAVGVASDVVAVKNDVAIVEVDRKRRREVPIESKGDDVYLTAVHQSVAEVKAGIASGQLPGPTPPWLIAFATVTDPKVPLSPIISSLPVPPSM